MRRALPFVLLLLAAPAAAEPFADRVVTYTIGTGGGAREADLPGVVLGGPRGAGAFQGSMDTFSLGLGGSIVLEFTDNVVVDGPGPDFTVFENPFLVRGTTTGAPYAEPGTVSVSADGVHWATFPCALDQPPYYPGCAGVYPDYATSVRTWKGVILREYVAEGKDTPAKAVWKYAPIGKDGNNPPAYIADMENWISCWRAKGPQACYAERGIAVRQ